MRPSRRSPQSKRAAARTFKRNVKRTKALNIIPMRGGYRL